MDNRRSAHKSHAGLHRVDGTVAGRHQCHGVAKLTGRPEEAVAETLNGGEPNGWRGSGPNVLVSDKSVMVDACTNGHGSRIGRVASLQSFDGATACGTHPPWRAE